MQTNIGLFLDKRALLKPEKTSLIALRLEPYAYGDGMTGTLPNAKMYWPIYAKCCEFDIPDSFIKFISSYGQDKALCATDYPLLNYKRCIDEVRVLGLPFECEKKIIARQHNQSL